MNCRAVLKHNKQRNRDDNRCSLAAVEVVKEVPVQNESWRQSAEAADA